MALMLAEAGRMEATLLGSNAAATSRDHRPVVTTHRRPRPCGAAAADPAGRRRLRSDVFFPFEAKDALDSALAMVNTKEQEKGRAPTLSPMAVIRSSADGIPVALARFDDPLLATAVSAMDAACQGARLRLTSARGRRASSPHSQT